jgi:hypothetical protein
VETFINEFAMLSTISIHTGSFQRDLIHTMGLLLHMHGTEFYMDMYIGRRFVWKALIWPHVFQVEG